MSDKTDKERLIKCFNKIGVSFEQFEDKVIVTNNKGSFDTEFNFYGSGGFNYVGVNEL